MVDNYINQDSGSQGSAMYYLTSAAFAAQEAEGQTTVHSDRTVTARGVS
jgi:hypothetical protein